MSIPNPNPNIADGISCDNKTYSSNKIESLIKTATELPIPKDGDAGKVLTVNSDSDGYELDTPVDPADVLKVIGFTIEDLSVTVPAGTIRSILWNEDITSYLPDGATLKAIIVETVNNEVCVSRSWVTSDNKIAISGGNPTGNDISVTSVTIKAFYI